MKVKAQMIYKTFWIFENLLALSENIFYIINVRRKLKLSNVFLIYQLSPYTSNFEKINTSPDNNISEVKNYG